MGSSWNGGTPIAGCFISWKILLKWMTTGGTSISGNLHVWINKPWLLGRFFFELMNPLLGRSGWQNPHEVILRRYQMVFFNVEGPVTRRSYWFLSSVSGNPAILRELSIWTSHSNWKNGRKHLSPENASAASKHMLLMLCMFGMFTRASGSGIKYESIIGRQHASGPAWTWPLECVGFRHILIYFL